MTATQPIKLTRDEIYQKYDGRWILFTQANYDPITLEWTEAVVIADVEIDHRDKLFEIIKELKLHNSGIEFVGESPYQYAILI